LEQDDKPATPAFMRIKGPLVGPMPPEATHTKVREFWLVQPWVIVTVVMVVLAALVIPGLFIDLTRGF